MLRINGHWESVANLRDISNIIRENYNRELADEMDKLIKIQEDEIRYLNLELLNAPIYDNGDDEWCDD